MSSSSSSTLDARPPPAADAPRCPDCRSHQRRALVGAPLYCVDCGWTWRAGQRYEQIQEDERLYIKRLLWRYFPLDERRASRLHAARIVLSERTRRILFDLE